MLLVLSAWAVEAYDWIINLVIYNSWPFFKPVLFKGFLSHFVPNERLGIKHFWCWYRPWAVAISVMCCSLDKLITCRYIPYYDMSQFMHANFFCQNCRFVDVVSMAKLLVWWLLVCHTCNDAYIIIVHPPPQLNPYLPSVFLCHNTPD